MGEGAALVGKYLDGRIAAGELRPHDTTVTARAIFWSIVSQHLSQGPRTTASRTDLSTSSWKGSGRRKPSDVRTITQPHWRRSCHTCAEVPPCRIDVRDDRPRRRSVGHALSHRQVRRCRCDPAGLRLRVPGFRVAGALYGLGILFGILAALNGALDLITPWLLTAYVLVGTLVATNLAFDRWSQQVERSVAEVGEAASPELAVLINAAVRFSRWRRW